MPRLKVTISYDGTAFSGFQIQPNGRTVQGEIERCLSKMHKGQSVRVTPSGRTDAGVHAVGQVIHFDSPLTIPETNWTKALNALLPDDVRAVKAEIVPANFHARYDVKRKEYRYRLLYRETPDLFRRHYTWHVPEALDLDAMRRGAAYLVGTHDFSSFCAAGSNVKNKVRTIYELEILRDADEVVVRIVGNGFLYNMVRIIVGNLLEVGKGHVPPEEIRAILEARDRRRAFETAPAHGLYLWRVDY